MRMTAHYQLVLHAGSDPEEFEALFAGDEMRVVLQTTRITSAFSTRLLRASDERPDDGIDAEGLLRRRYIWEVDVTLMTGAGYGFSANTDALQQRVAELATVYRLDTFAVTAET